MAAAACLLGEPTVRVTGNAAVAAGAIVPNFDGMGLNNGIGSYGIAIALFALGPTWSAVAVGLGCGLPLAVVLALAIVLLGFLMMIVRRNAVTQVVGFMSMENGLILAATGARGMPLGLMPGMSYEEKPEASKLIAWLCSVCDGSLMVESGKGEIITMIGLSIKINDFTDFKGDQITKLKKLGFSGEVNVCYACWFESLGMKGKA